MFDADQHQRFMRSAADAFIEGADALMAASRAWQDAVRASYSALPSPPPKPIAPMPLEPFAAWSWAFDLCRRQPAVAPAMKAALAWRGATMSHLVWPVQAFEAPASMYQANPIAHNPAELMQAMITAYWTLPPIAWSMYQGPMTMMMVGAGMPYDVAAPAARASVAAMDAADAVRLQAISAVAMMQGEGARQSVTYLTPNGGDAAARRARRRASFN